MTISGQSGDSSTLRQTPFDSCVFLLQIRVSLTFGETACVETSFCDGVGHRSGNVEEER